MLIDNPAVPLYQYSRTHKPMLLRINSINGQPLYLQVMQQIRHAIETGALQHGEQLPGIRTLAEDLVVSPNTVSKAYSDLEREGLLELRQGSGAFVTISRNARSQVKGVRDARVQMQKLIADLRGSGLQDDEILRIVEAELYYPAEVSNEP